MLVTLIALSAPATAADPVPPVVTLGRERRRHGAGHWLRVTPPDGLELDENSPVELEIVADGLRVEARLPAEAFSPGLPLGALGEGPVEGTIRTVLCDSETHVCTRSAWTVSGTPPRRGTSRLTVRPPSEAPRFGPGSDTGAVAAAFDAAKQSGKPVLLDFSAVWCPPCMQLAAEVLDADPAPIVLDGVHVAVVDVDHPSSFGLKDRYDVGGYPTVVLAAPDGAEVSRMLGYPGREAWLDWLAEAVATPDPAEPDAQAPEDAARTALQRLAQGDLDAARRYADSAAERGFDGPDLRVVRARTQYRPEDVAWLLDNAPDRLVEARYALMQLSEPRERPLVDRAIDHLVRTATGEALVEVYDMRSRILRERGEAAAAEEAATIAANLLVAMIDRDEASARAYLSWLAELFAAAGQLERGVARLEAASRAHPSDPTFDLALAHRLVEAERYEDALEAAERAAERSWGDIALRTALWHGRALVGLGRVDEAEAVVQAALAPTDGLDPEIDVRSHRYRQRLIDWWEGVAR